MFHVVRVIPRCDKKKLAHPSTRALPYFERQVEGYPFCNGGNTVPCFAENGVEADASYRPVFAALWNHFETEFLLIRITDMNKYLDGFEMIVKEYVLKPSAKYLRVSYTDRNQQFRVLCGSV